MAWRLGEWKVYYEGEVHQVTKKILMTLWDKGFKTVADFRTERKEILPKDKGLFEVLLNYEKEKGISELLGLLTKGLKIKATKDGQWLDLALYMSSPEESEEKRRLFKGAIIEWVENDELTFSQRFFRFPKISEDFADRFLDNPLEKMLKKTFGFNFRYKVLIHCRTDSKELQKLRSPLYKILYER